MTTRVRLKNEPLYNNTDSDIHIVYSMLISLLSSLTIIGYTERELARDSLTLKTRLEHEGLSFATISLPLLGRGLLDFIETGVGLYPGFKTCKYGYPSLFKGLFRLAYDSSSADRTQAIKVLYQLSEMFKKLRGPFDQGKLKNQLNEFIEVDAELPDVHGDEILHYARYLITEVFKDCEDDVFNIIPRPGPGATNTPIPLNERFRPNAIFSKVDDVFSYGEYFYSTWYEFCDDRKRLKQLYASIRSEQTARFQFVPKKVGTARGICIEENDVQYLQQGVAKFLRDNIKKSPLCCSNIHFRHQDFNAQAAKLASASGLLATLDMKEASDRISRSLVSYLFSRLPLIKDALMCLSTEVVDLTKALEERNGTDIPENIRVKKFAPMGSALCFPIMSIVHWALIKAVIKVQCRSNPHSKRLFIFGDDLILPSSLAEEIMNVLPNYGLKFNITKSFYRGKFRESCGIHAYHGENITPIYVKCLPHRAIDATSLSSVIANEQSFDKLGYHQLASYVRSRISLPFVHTTSNVVGWKRPNMPYVDLRARRKYDQDLQRYVYRCRVFKSLKKGSNPRMPSPSLVTVLTKRQIEYLTLGSNWVENEAYLRALLLGANEHDRHWANDSLIYHYKWL